MERLWNSNYIKVWTANFMLFLSFYLIVPLLPLFLHDTFNADKQTIGLVLCGYTITALLIRPFSGFMVDSFNRRKVLLLCYFFFALFFAGYLIASSLLLFTIVRTLHGAPFGATTVANSTVMIDVLPSSRRTEGIGYYGMSNNLAMALGPSIGLYMYNMIGDFQWLFTLSLAIGLTGFAIDSTIHFKTRETIKVKEPLSFDRFFLTRSIPESITIAALSFSFGVASTYLAIYSRDIMHISAGTGVWFALLAIGLISSRIVGGRSLRKGRIIENAGFGMTLSVVGYLLFVAVPNEFGYYAAALIIGLGNGHMFPAMQNMFINLAENNRRGTANSSLLTSWDVGIGSGIILGGIVSEAISYSAAFWLSFIVNASGVLFFWCYARQHYLTHKVR
ncbi:MAG: MFS transporter [Marinilabiliaceae bacterium]|nr:MFS transporter [Marinilabiliaceae bacterium]